MIVSQAGALVLIETIAAVGLDRALSKPLVRWWLPLAIHDPGKVLADLALTLALGGDCLADGQRMSYSVGFTLPGDFTAAGQDPRARVDPGLQQRR